LVARQDGARCPGWRCPKTAPVSPSFGRAFDNLPVAPLDLFAAREAVARRPTASIFARREGMPIDTDPHALAILHEWVKTTGAEMNERACA
jgi:hypothetical protein